MIISVRLIRGRLKTHIVPGMDHCLARAVELNYGFQIDHNPCQDPQVDALIS